MRWAKFKEIPPPVLKLDVEYKFLNPEGGACWYEIIIKKPEFNIEYSHFDASSFEKLPLLPWKEVKRDKFLITDHTKGEPGYHRDYDLWVPSNVFQTEPFNFNFQITAGIQPNYLQRDVWIYETREFCATFNRCR